jgi:hypothetical protein
METIEIAIVEYYNKPQYFPFMPEVIFNALEAAFLEGKETAEVPKVEFESMLSEYQNKK